MSWRRKPRLELTGTLSHKSLSQSATAHVPVILKLSVCLANPEEPITISKSGSFLNSSSDGFYLRSTRDGSLVSSSSWCFFTGSLSDTIAIHADDLLTLYHGVPIEVNVILGGPCISTIPRSGKERYFCGTDLKELRCWDVYEVDWSPSAVQLGASGLLWWDRGTKEEVVAKHMPWWKYILGFRTFYVERGFSEGAGIDVRVIQMPKILIEK
ncbi:hypothetical protein B0J14DRAFT_597615 [Halenospora varia]|nr:hypothetical protein B0J14DRAFT_597615 [Halenospora varia]